MSISFVSITEAEDDKDLAMIFCVLTCYNRTLNWIPKLVCFWVYFRLHWYTWNLPLHCHQFLFMLPDFYNLFSQNSGSLFLVLFSQNFYFRLLKVLKRNAIGLNWLLIFVLEGWDFLNLYLNCVHYYVNLFVVVFQSLQMFKSVTP